jgi:hypothetical protein
MKLEIGENWVRLREPENVPEKLRRRVVTRSLAAKGIIDNLNGEVGITETEAEFISEFNDILILALVKEWSYEHPITSEGLLELGGRDYDAIFRECNGLLGRLMPNFEVDPDPKATTEP